MKASLLIVMIVAPLLISVGRQTNGTPGAGYTWSLGDLAADSARLDIDWDHSGWADDYDTEAEMNALGWTTVNITDGADGIECDDGGVDDSSDESAFSAILAANCNTAVGSGLPNACNNVFKIAANCTIDLTAVDTGTSAPTEAAPALNIPYSNIAIIGADQDTSKIDANNQNSATVDDGIGVLLGNNVSFASGAETGTLVDWLDSDTAVKGQTSIAINGSCAAISYESSPDADGVDESSIIRVVGQDDDGVTLSYQTRVSAKSGSTDCTIGLTDPIPADFNTPGEIRVLAATRQSHVIFHNLTIGYPHIGIGLCTSDGTEQDCAGGFDFDGVNNLLFDNVVLGPVGVLGHATRTYNVVLRNSDLGPNYHGMRRPNNNNTFWNSGSSLQSFYNNVMLPGMVRITLTHNVAMFSYVGFNFWASQTAPNSYDTGGSGNYCGERSVFINHDNPFDVNGGSETIGHFLFEANDADCVFLNEGVNDTRRYGTHYRNRFTGTSPTISFNTNGTHVYQNFFANRLGSWSWGGGTNKPNALGRWNVAESSTSAPGGTGVTWPTSSTGKNYVDTSEHDDSATVNLPPSLAFRQDAAPSWWCQESGAWAALGDDDTAFSFGYADGYLGTTHKLPAQIRYEGTTCTPP